MLGVFLKHYTNGNVCAKASGCQLSGIKGKSRTESTERQSTLRNLQLVHKVNEKQNSKTAGVVTKRQTLQEERREPVRGGKPENLRKTEYCRWCSASLIM